MNQIHWNRIFKAGLSGSLGLSLFAGPVFADTNDDASHPFCLEGNFMVADAQNAPFSSVPGPGRVLELNLNTGERGITVDSPKEALEALGLTNVWKPTGVLSGGVDGHAFIAGSAWHTISEFHRDGDHIRTVRLPTAAPISAGPGAMPTLNGLQFMPNGNIIVTVCDHSVTDGSVFPPVSSTPEQNANSRLVVLDPETLQMIDEYIQPENADPRWSCASDIIFSSEGMLVSTFHGAATFVIDWKAGAKNIKKSGDFKPNDLNKNDNRAKVIRVIDMYPDAPLDDPRRRDSLRATTFGSNGTLYVVNRARAKEVGNGPADNRAHIDVIPWGDSGPVGTLAMDHGIQIIAGARTNRVSAKGCAKVREEDPSSPCDFETLLVASSSTGMVHEFRIGADFLDGPDCRDHNVGCAQPIAEFLGPENGQDKIDPRMLMIIHESFIQ